MKKTVSLPPASQEDLLFVAEPSGLNDGNSIRVEICPSLANILQNSWIEDPQHLEAR